MSRYFKYNTPSRQLRKVYGADGWIAGFGSIGINTSINVQDQLLKECTLEQMQKLKTELSAQVEFMKQLNLIITITTFILTLVINPVNFYIQQSLKTIDWRHEVRSLVVSEELDQAKDGEKRWQILLDYAKQTKTDGEEYNKSLSDLQNQFYSMLEILIIPFLLSIIILFFRYKWLLSALGCMEDTLKAKESELKKRQEVISRREKRLGALRNS